MTSNDAQFHRTILSLTLSRLRSNETALAELSRLVQTREIRDTAASLSEEIAFGQYHVSCLKLRLSLDLSPDDLEALGKNGVVLVNAS